MNNILIDEKILRLSTYNKVIENIEETDYTQRSETFKNVSNEKIDTVFDIFDRLKNYNNNDNNHMQDDVKDKVKDDVSSMIKLKDYVKLIKDYDLLIIENFEIVLLHTSNKKKLIISIDDKVVDDEQEVHLLFADKLNEVSYSTLCRLFKFINIKNKDKPKSGKQKRKDLENNIHNFFVINK